MVISIKSNKTADTVIEEYIVSAVLFMKFKKWELALVIALLITVPVCALTAQQSELENKLIRLHVVANSDSTEDQSLKLQVRDRVLEEMEGVLSDCADKKEAADRIEPELRRIEAVAEDRVRELGANYTVKATLKEEEFPTVAYDNFTLPAGKYTALRVEIGQAEGHNWWCVIFPPLCVTAASDTASFEQMGLSQGTAALISGDTEGCTVKFKTLEWFEKIKAYLSGGK
jgi:stage II sporulation protein R